MPLWFPVMWINIKKKQKNPNLAGKWNSRRNIARDKPKSAVKFHELAIFHSEFLVIMTGAELTSSLQSHSKSILHNIFKTSFCLKLLSFPWASAAPGVLPLLPVKTDSCPSPGPSSLLFPLTLHVFIQLSLKWWQCLHSSLPVYRSLPLFIPMNACSMGKSPTFLTSIPPLELEKASHKPVGQMKCIFLSIGLFFLSSPNNPTRVGGRVWVFSFLIANSRPLFQLNDNIFVTTQSLKYNDEKWAKGLGIVPSECCSRLNNGLQRF